MKKLRNLRISLLIIVQSCTVNVSEVTNEGDGRVVTEERTETKADTDVSATPSMFHLF
jgi:hypothetical protein